MRLFRLGDRYLNLELLIDAQFTANDKGKGPRLALVFASPSPASVGAADWTVTSREVTLLGDDALHVRRKLDHIVETDLS